MLNILIVDDDKILCECLLKLMPWEDMGCNTPHIAYNGMEAWEMLQREKYDFIICDLMMPFMGGLELSKLIHENMINVEMVFLSAYEDFSSARMALQYGVTDYILKPINKESIGNLETIIRFNKRKKYKKQLEKVFLNSDYTKTMFTAFINHDKFFFQKMFEDLELLDEQVIQNAGISILYVLHDYLCMINKKIERNIYDMLLKRWQAEFVSINGSSQKVDYIRKLCQNEFEQNNSELETDHLVVQIQHLIKENYCKPECNVSWIANRMYMNSAYIGRIFNNYMGIGVMEYITECRMEKACQMLSNESTSIRKIGEEVGYPDSGYFTKIFRKNMGMSPSEYRMTCTNRQ